VCALTRSEHPEVDIVAAPMPPQEEPCADPASGLLPCAESAHVADDPFVRSRAVGTRFWRRGLVSQWPYVRASGKGPLPTVVDPGANIRAPAQEVVR
jgi:hypothetical protein